MFVFSSRRRHTRWPRDWSSDVCSSDLKALEKSDLPVDSVQLIEDTSREKAKDFFRMNDYLDVLIPRGSEKLIEVEIGRASCRGKSVEVGGRGEVMTERKEMVISRGCVD